MQVNEEGTAVAVQTIGSPTIPSRKHRYEVWFYYVEYIGFTIFEGALIRGINWFASWRGIKTHHMWVCWVVFSLGGWMFGYAQRKTHVGESKWLPLRWACWIQEHLGFAGMLFNSGVFGSIGACIALEHTNTPRRKWLYPLTGFAFASVWVPLLSV